jgi:hypothetical protein
LTLLRTLLRSLHGLTVLGVGLKGIAVIELLSAPFTYKSIRILSHISSFQIKLLGVDVDSGAKSFPIQILPLPGE